ncbi:ISL3 family transposase [Xanthomonas oryzae]|uniref:ISL3 family transposase n=1 Tax=Xanthomonas oryzae TaxID=347 RepID=UPI001034F045|nr:ISL3 family transposase [Xanthomonas oryzae]QBG99172.1 ISL3 family transposase [Xanthomonas oryzae]
MPTNILNLPAYRVTRVEEDEHDYHVYAEVMQPVAACIHCRSDSLVGFGRRERHVKDLPMHARRVGLYIDTRRFQCRSCGKTFYETLPDVTESRWLTTRLARWIGQQSLKRPFLSISDETGIDEKTVRNIFRDYINELEAQVRFETPKIMGIDEIHLIKPRCVISNIGNNTLVDLLPNRNKDSVLKYLAKMDRRDKVQVVAMDMWTPYRDAVETMMPQAVIVIDKFHVVRMANDAVEKARKALRVTLTPPQRRGLMHDRFVLLKRQRDLTDKDRLNLDGWTKNYPALGEAYRAKEAFYGIYEAESPEDAVQRYAAWEQALTPEIRPYFADLLRAWSNWRFHILNYFEHPVTNAYTESLNNLIRVMNRLGRGYSFEALRAKILFTEGIHKHTRSRPKYQKRAPDRGPRSTKAPRTASGAAPPRPVAPKNYGTDIDRLVAMLERGEL